MHLYKFNNRRTYTFPLVFLLAFVCRNEHQKSDVFFFFLKANMKKLNMPINQKLWVYSSKAPPSLQTGTHLPWLLCVSTLGPFSARILRQQENKTNKETSDTCLDPRHEDRSENPATFLCNFPSTPPVTPTDATNILSSTSQCASHHNSLLPSTISSSLSVCVSVITLWLRCN